MTTALRVAIARKVLRLGDVLRNICNDVALGTLDDASLSAYYADYYDRERGRYPAYRLQEERLIPIILSLAPGRELLDVFCGQGREARIFAEREFSVTAIDASAQMITLAREQNESRGANVTFMNADARTFQSQKKFDVIYLSSLMYGSFRGKRARLDLLRNLKTLLQPNGIIAISYAHYSRRTAFSLHARYHLQNVARFLTMSQAVVERGDRINKYFLHYFSNGEFSDEMHEGGFEILTTVAGVQIAESFAFLRRRR